MQFSSEKSTNIKFKHDSPKITAISTQEPWEILVVDDDEGVHEVTKLVLKGYTFDHRPINLTHAYSAKEATKKMAEYRDYSIILLDVVMETDSAGLDLVNYIRGELNNQSIRIILRTGQPGEAPEHRVIIDYDINDYKEKSDLTYNTIRSCITTALRSYRDLNTIQKLVTSREELQRKITKRNDELHSVNQQLEKEITERIEVEKTLKKTNNQLKSMIDNSLSSISLKDRDGNYELVNRQFLTDINMKESYVIGKNDHQLFGGKIASEIRSNDYNVIKTGESLQCEEMLLINGVNNFYISVKFPIFDQNGDFYRICSMNTNITERLDYQNEIIHLAQFDLLTNLPNRVLFIDRIDQAISRTKWNKQNVAILFIDLDRFKIVNDSLGHDVGDQLLVKVSERLKSLIRKGDSACRLGGDEFALLLVDISSQKDIVRLVKKIITSLSAPYKINNRDLVVTPSIGISRSPIDGDDVNVLLKKSDVAMYKAKKAGKNTYRFYLSEDDNNANEQLLLEADLRKAIENNQFYLAYQPKVNVDDGEIYGFEALLRWNHPIRGEILPGEFIPILEETGLIIDVGIWVFNEACTFATKSAFAGNPIKIAVNLSSLQFKQDDFIKTLKKTLKATNCSPEWLEIELTEGALIDDFSRVNDSLREISNMGINLAIDDFGTGYSSMNYLKCLPFDTLKIDRSFIVDAPNKPKDHAIVTTIFQLAHNLGMKVVAEGVESIEQYQIIKTINSGIGKCEIQGFIFSKAITKEKICNIPKTIKTKWNDIDKNDC